MNAKQPEVLAVVPARGGSKSIPRKNALLFLGHPLLAYSVAAGVQATRVTRTIISTDDAEMAELAREYGAEAPFLRPAEFARDDSQDLSLFQHALGWLAENEKYKPDIVVQLRPTSPLRPPGLVDEAVEVLLSQPEADSVRGVVPSGQNPYKMWSLTEGGVMQPLLKVKGNSEPYNSPRQELPATYWQTGHVDAIRATTILKKGSMSGASIWPVHVDPRYTVDIDTPNDWRRAEWLAASGELDIVWPGAACRPLPDTVRLLVLDFDGVMTDNRVWVDQDGREQVAANRSDGLGLMQLRKAGVELLVISMETNPVVARRCEKLGIAYHQGIDDKATLLKQILAEKNIPAAETVYVGNDTNDLPCFPLVGCAVAVGDAHSAVLREADIVLIYPGGRGAVRELCDLIMQRLPKESK
ncbi:MAG: acylneuraminate cytidylyltransferase [Anaerolineales bacterium]|nr:acylneuraminate cytidylyltransferase [Anaerolineales bacterium]